PDDVQARHTERRVIGIDPADEGKYRILVVDDRWENRRLLVEWLRQVGFAVSEAANGREAGETWERTEPHLIWMDIRMPVMDGYEATKIIRSHAKGQNAIIIALTASILDQEQLSVRAAGCDDFVRKPVRASVVFDKMAEHLGVRYIFEEKETTETATGADLRVTQVALSRLPADWIAALRQAADEINIGEAKTIIAQIRAQDGNLAKTLDDLIDNYRFDQLQALAQQA